MDQTQPLSPARFLELLNKPNRSMQEENELQTELKRQEAAKAGTATPVESIPANQETKPVDPAPAKPAAQTVAQAQAETPAPTEPKQDTPAYDLNQLKDETETAIAFLEGQPNSIATEMAKAAFTQAAYWTKLASEGK